MPLLSVQILLGLLEQSVNANAGHAENTVRMAAIAIFFISFSTTFVAWRTAQIPALAPTATITKIAASAPPIVPELLDAPPTSLNVMNDSKTYVMQLVNSLLKMSTKKRCMKLNRIDCRDERDLSRFRTRSLTSAGGLAGCSASDLNGAARVTSMRPQNFRCGISSSGFDWRYWKKAWGCTCRA